MRINQLKSALIMTLIGAVTAQSAMAQKAGDNVATFGAAYISFDSSVGALTSSGANPAESGAFNAVNNTLGTTTAKANNTGLVTASFLHMLTDHWAGEIVLGVPPKVKMNLNIPGAGIAYAGAIPTSYKNGASAKSWTPTVFAKYLFNEPTDGFRPYLGLGISYAWFSNVQFENATLLNTLSGGGAKLSSSWNPVATLGAIYNLNEKWSLVAAASYMPLKSTTTLTSGSGVTTTTGVLKLDSTIYNVSVGYKF